MNIIIPLGGKGERFKNEGFNEPKPLIKIFNKPMILYVLDNLDFNNEDKFFIIYNTENIDKHIFEKYIKSKYPNIYLIELNIQTHGAAETILHGINTIKNISDYKKTMILDCDTFYTENVINIYRNINYNTVFFVKNTEINPIYSYINLNDENSITDIKEKIKISDNANTGIYCFDDIDLLYKYSKKVIDENITFNNEYYTSCIIDQMIKDNHVFKGIELNNKYVFNLGTPSQLKYYLDNTFCFLFDLDGTIILSENIYFDIWKEIFNKYDMELNKDIFDNNISGNNDKTVFNTFFHDKNISLTEISNKKDELFIKNIYKVKLIEGIETLLNDIKNNGHKLGLVTNCNRNISEFILNHFNIKCYFDIIIIGNECNNPKPYPDPYIKAISDLGFNNKKTVIFEDSKSGLLSASSVMPFQLIGLETIYSKEELLNYNVNETIKNYLNFDYKKIISNFNVYTHDNISNNKIIELKNMIKKSLFHYDIKNIEIDTNKLKGGFISDVIGVNITINNNNEIYDTIQEPHTINCVIKMENKNETFLTKMSQDLDLYNREYYFYDTISKYIPIKFPKFLGLIKDNDFNNIGILLENLNTENFTLNLNLNKVNINIIFNVIDSLALLHSKFWNKDLSKHFIYLKKNNNTSFQPFWGDFIKSKWDLFKFKWSNILNSEHLNIGEYIVNNFNNIQNQLSNNINLTLCHGDIKSANIFYKKINNDNYEPYFIDWQYISNGKGVQDLVFFMIESFNIEKMKQYKLLLKEYYFIKLKENEIHYDREQYNEDFKNASFYFPFFVAIWFGTISEDELIDKNFPVDFIQKLFNFYII